MKARYIALMVSMLCVSQSYGAKKPNEDYLRSELKRLLIEMQPGDLSLSDVRKVHSLLHDLTKIDKKSADHIKMQYLEIQPGCCEDISEFKTREIALEIKDIFSSPQPKNSAWKHKAENLLAYCYHFGYHSDCAEGGEQFEPLASLYKKYEKIYNKLTGHTYKPKRPEEKSSEYSRKWYEENEGAHYPVVKWHK